MNTAAPQIAKIGQAARLTGLSVDTIRFYEKQRLLRRPPRTEGGYRLFSLQDIETLRFIRQLQQLGFSLAEIREVLVLRSDQAPACVHLRELLEEKLEAVRTKMEELRRLESVLKAALGKCRRQLRQRDSSHRGPCPVLEEIGRSATVKENTKP